MKDNTLIQIQKVVVNGGIAHYARYYQKSLQIRQIASVCGKGF